MSNPSRLFKIWHFLLLAWVKLRRLLKSDFDLFRVFKARKGLKCVHMTNSGPFYVGFQLKQVHCMCQPSRSCKILNLSVACMSQGWRRLLKSDFNLLEAFNVRKETKCMHMTNFGPRKFMWHFSTKGYPKCPKYAKVDTFWLLASV